MVAAIRQGLRDDHATGLLTNNFLTGTPEWSSSGDPSPELVDLFDVVVESSMIGFRKPETEFYEIARPRAHGVGADEAVFLDDLGINLKPARAMGMTTIKVADPDDALAQLATVLGTTFS